jgi:hypothetical protein
MPNQLTTLESKRLASCEQVIQEGIDTFVDLGNALLEIRDGRLYRDEFHDFQTYCKESGDSTALTHIA